MGRVVIFGTILVFGSCSYGCETWSVILWEKTQTEGVGEYGTEEVTRS